jgi:glycosyltransferase involved in cell wall biosynthesis
VDRDALERHRPPSQQILDLPPFIDAEELGRAPPRHPAPAGTPIRLLAVGMMRHRDKLDSYGLLAQSLRLLRDRAWTLDIVGDGPARAEVEALFRPIGQQVAFRGCIEDAMALSAAYAQADLLVWPAVNEAYGMVLLEAQAMSCPVLAGGYGGVASVMQPGRTGLMPPPGDVEAFARDLAALIADPHRRAAMGQAALIFVRRERNLDGAAAILRAALRPLILGVGAA